MSTAPWAGAVEDVRRALAPKGRRQLRQFAVEGLRLVRRALHAGQAPKRVVVSEGAARRDPEIAELMLRLAEAGVEIIKVPEGVVLEMAQGRNDGVIFGLCDIPEHVTLGELCQRAMNGGGPLLVLLDLEEPGNVGALVRTALASGAAGLVALGTTDPFHPKAVRTSMGSLFRLPIVRCFEIEPVLEQLTPLQRVAAVPQGGQPPWALDLDSHAALFIGGEANGLPESLVEQLDAKVSIPMPWGVDSFSVNAAAAILLYEVRRRAATP